VIKISKTKIQEAAKDRPAGYQEDMHKNASTECEHFLYFDKKTYQQLRVKYSYLSTEPVSFVYPFWQGGANYDELRWSIRSIYQNFIPAKGQSFNIVIVGDQPLIRRTNKSWYNGPIIACPRISRGKTFRPKLKDALHKWRTALDSDLVSDTIVWMMDDVYFLKPFTLGQLAVPRAFKQKSQNSLENWKEHSGFSSAKKRSIEILINNNLPSWDFATHLPHVVERGKVLEVFDKFEIEKNELLWEVVYENYYLNGRKPERAYPYLSYFTEAQSTDAIRSKAFRCNVLVNGGGSWNEQLRIFLYDQFPQAAPEEILPPPPCRPNPEIKNEWMSKIAACPERMEIIDIVSSKTCSRRGIELPVFRCNKFGRCTIDQYQAGQTEKVCKRCEMMHE